MKQDRFTGGDNLTDMEKYVHEMMMLNELIAGTEGYKLSHAQKGQSGYSFGGNQMDLTHNEMARTILKDVLTQHKIKLEKIDAFMKTFQENKKLDNSDIALIDAALSSDYGMKKINEIYQQEIKKMISAVKNVIKNVHELIRVFVQDPKVQLILIDYHNQFSLDVNGKMHQVLQGKTVQFSKKFSLDLKAIHNATELIEQIRQAIKCTKWGSTEAGLRDIARRQNNIDSIAARFGLDHNTSVCTMNL